MSIVYILVLWCEASSRDKRTSQTMQVSMNIVSEKCVCLLAVGPFVYFVFV